MGYRFRIDPDTRGTAFVLHTQDLADFDIEFHGRSNHRRYMGGVVASQDMPTLADVRGTVPSWATEATVCLVAGANARFTYSAG
jgi:hypothetical protein